MNVFEFVESSVVIAIEFDKIGTNGSVVLSSILLGLVVLILCVAAVSWFVISPSVLDTKVVLCVDSVVIDMLVVPLNISSFVCVVSSVLLVIVATV
jgi:hypothetical protein